MTEYVTGLPARIGFPNEHLAAGHIEELAKPTYSTCIGLILKGYDDYEHNRKEFDKEYKKVEVPDGLKQIGQEKVPEEVEEMISEREMKKRKKVGIMIRSKITLRKILCCARNAKQALRNAYIRPKAC